MRLRYKALLVGITFVVAAALLAFAGTVTFRSPEIPTVHVIGTSISLEVADTAAERERGLGRRETLDRDSGMLFVFDDAAKRCFWMKDVVFPLDIIWLSSDKRILEVRTDIRPESFPQTFCSEHPAQYAIELNSGRVAELGWQPGTVLNF